MNSQIKDRILKTDPKLRFNQCDVLKDLIIYHHSDTVDGELILSTLLLSYSIVVNQECDLLHDFNARNDNNSNSDKYLPNIIVLPCYLSEDFRDGSHRGDMSCTKWNSELFKKIRQNNDARFHFLPGHALFQIPDLIIDFKHIYTVNRDVLYKQISELYIGSIAEVYRDHISQRYTNYLSRIGLPEVN